jgi:hypothetical protein
MEQLTVMERGMRVLEFSVLDRHVDGLYEVTLNVRVEDDQRRSRFDASR